MNQIKSWLDNIGWEYDKIEVASSDASFRSYYRVYKDETSYVLMDSSKQIDSLKPFLDIQTRLFSVGVRVPQVLQKNLELGFLILEDFGSTHLLDVLNDDNKKEHYRQAIDEIVLMQKADVSELPLYDKEFLIFEMSLMNEWYLDKHLNIHLDIQKLSILTNIIETIADEVLSQPQGVFVHRDFHSRNIMIDKNGKLGIIDFQDARCGSITYDLVSLLKDCYIETDEVLRDDLVLYFRDKKGLDVDDGTMLRWFDMMGLQRHIKVLGIFARLYHRDGKDGYLKDIPLTLKYVLETADKYPQTKQLCEILK
ncbi:MAG: phosphotransferase [Sulfurovaceae bacterium]|nr:phosphotransferase [Sulfurovaceae bacterium]MDD5548607.1 phosphotransferase [Sulfurovaceae bacterium]